MNPAVDRTVLADRLVFEDRAYILSRKDSAGGRGINSSAVIHSFGGKTLAIATCGGGAGAKFERHLQNCGFPVEIVRIQQDIRVNLTVTDKQGLTIKLNEIGPTLMPEELELVEKAVMAQLGQASWLMLCGSLPPGVPSSFYRKLIQKARASDTKVLLDTDGDPLLEGIEAVPSVVAPNQQEAERLLGRVLLTRTHFFDAAERIVSMGAGSVVLSLGARGAVGFDRSIAFEAVPPRIDAVSPIGSGDALAAAFVWASANGSDFADAVRWGVAAGTASAMLPGLQFASLDQARAMHKRVEIRQRGSGAAPAAT
jgi:1-phosphofructokinase family hexose kinase